MKKIMFFATFVVAMMFASCGNKAVTSDEATVAEDSVEVTTDTVSADSAVVEELTVDSACVEE